MCAPLCGSPLLTPRQHRVHPGDERSELLHVLPEDLLSGLVGDTAVSGNQPTFELHVRFDGIHQRRIAEGENAAQMLLCDGGADLAGRRPRRTSAVARSLLIDAFATLPTR